MPVRFVTILSKGQPRRPDDPRCLIPVGSVPSIGSSGYTPTSVKGRMPSPIPKRRMTKSGLFRPRGGSVCKILLRLILGVVALRYVNRLLSRPVEKASERVKPTPPTPPLTGEYKKGCPPPGGILPFIASRRLKGPGRGGKLYGVSRIGLFQALLGIPVFARAIFRR